MSATVTLEPWGSGELPLLERLMGDPRMTEHLGGPESPERLRERQARYEQLTPGDRMLKIVDAASGAGVGSVGYWMKEWRGGEVYEVGWMVVPEFQGRGIAVAATAQAIELAKQDDMHRLMHAFPNVGVAFSQALASAPNGQLRGHSRTAICGRDVGVESVDWPPPHPATPTTNSAPSKRYRTPSWTPARADQFRRSAALHREGRRSLRRGARAVVAFVGIWYGLIATGAALAILTIRAAAYSVEYFG